MSELEEFLFEKVEPSPVEGEIGEETGWLQFCNIQLAGARFAVLEALVLPDASGGALIDCSAGQYQVLAKVVDYSGERWISRLRIVRFDLEEANDHALPALGLKPILGPLLAEISLDTDLLAIYDQEVVDAVWESVGEEEGDEFLDEAFAEGESLGILTFGQATVPFLAVGFGEGEYEVLELLQDNERVGFEIEFIAPGEPYPEMEPAEEDAPEAHAEAADPETEAPEEPEMIPAFDRPFRIFAKAYQQFLQRRTGDEAKDQALARELAESILNQLDRPEPGNSGSL